LPSGLGDDELAALEHLVENPSAGPGVRLFGNARLATWIDESSVLRAAEAILGTGAQPVRAILFDKSEETNWSVGWHQDRTIAVRKRAEEPGFDHWTMKSGVRHAEPPPAVIERLITARIHLDAVDETNSPLMVAPGSHRLGRIGEPDVAAVVERCGSVSCLAQRGDVWLYRTSILHASERSSSGAGRRVLQIDFANEDLPGRLEWLGVA